MTMPIKSRVKLFFATSSLKEFKLIKAACLALATILLLLLCIGTAAATAQQENLGYWSNWQNSEAADGQSTVPMSFPSISASDSTLYGSNFQPLIGDLNSDGVNEIFISSSSYLFTYHGRYGVILTDSQYTMLGSQSYQAALARNGTLDFIVMPHAEMIDIYGFNGTIYLKQSINTTAFNATIGTGIICDSYLREAPYLTSDVCFFGTTNKRFAEYYISTNTLQSSHIGTVLKGTGALSINFNGAKMAFSNWTTGCLGGAGQTADVYVIVPVYPFSVERKLRLPNYYCANNLGFYDIDNAGFDELIISAGSNAEADLYAIDSNGNTVHSATIHDYGGGGTGTISGFVVGHFSKNIPQICAWSYNAYSISNYFSRCFNASDFKVVYNIPFVWEYPSKIITTNMVAIDTDQDGKDELVTPYHIIDVNGNTYFNLSTNSGGYIAVGDVDNNGNADIIGSAAGKTWVATAGAFGTTVNGSGVVLTTNGKDLEVSYDNPVCIGTSLQFTAYDCANTTYSSFCNYIVTNNLTREALYTGCTNTVLPIYTGGFSRSTPTVSCYMNKSGNYQITLYLVTESQLSDFSHKYVMAVNVINQSVALGINCNVRVHEPTLPIIPVTGTGTQERQQSDINNFVYTLTGGGSPLIKALIMVVLTVMLIIYLSKETKMQNPVIYAGAVFMLWIALALVGIISMVYPIIYALVIGLASAVYWVKGGQSNQ